ncbi:hypothetical protein [Sphingobium yanoikuyae]|nr:hypothetical protein [Sphingobium yanoikuyae]
MIVRAAPLALAASAVLASQAHAQAALEYVVQRAGNRDQSGHILVDVRVLNAGAAAQEVRLPDEVAADLVSNGTYRKVWLQRGEKQAAVLTIRPMALRRRATGSTFRTSWTARPCPFPPGQRSKSS